MKNDDKMISHLNSCLAKHNMDAFLIALLKAVKAHGTITDTCKTLKKSRTNFYKTLCRDANPELKSINEVLNFMGLKLSIAPKKKDKE